VNARSYAVFLSIGIALLAPPGAARAQIPETFKNLEVLPKDIKKNDLVSMMRGFSGALGVRCNHCHVGDNPNNLEGYDFASDQKDKKKIARVMMQMVHEINGELLPKTGIEKPMQVRCVTCHRGLPRPETLETALRSTVEKEGVPAAEKRYRELREQYYGSGAYDFRPGSVNMVAEWLAFEKKDYDGAVEILGLNAEFHPKVAYTHNLIGRIQEAKGDKAAAIVSYKKALELDPNDGWSKDLLEKAEGKK
jgi:tetratricopeptide (TPR) repeat protein